MSSKKQEKLFDLLSTRAIYGLSEEELKELKALEEEFPEWRDDESFEIAATAINLAAAEQPDEPMPAHLESRILADAETFFKTKQDSAHATEMREVSSLEDSSAAEAAGAAKIPAMAPIRSFWQWFGWGVAAFATIALAVNLYLTSSQNTPEMAETPDLETPAAADLTDAEERERLLASTQNLIRTEVAEAAPGKMPEITGDIVWDNVKQKGYMRFKGLPVNDPSKEQYQLWIFDENQDEKYPIDGGVFDVSKDGEVIIPIDAKIRVQKPTMFAVTREKPGGVVVSDRSGIIVVGKV